ncbi:hydrogenase-1 expression HyaE [Acidithiobacillus sp. GGI-221]|jgi:hydrogenase-1 operon protein HyaE|nr:hydrogenase-1 expression HyaE [Acidithiobacillus sp. GGI-221]
MDVGALRSLHLRRLVDYHGFSCVTQETVDAFVNNGTVVLLFAGDPARYPEANDVAVILPELAATFSGRFRTAVVAAGAEKSLQARYGVTVWPTLVFLRQGIKLGAISRMRDWGEYLREIAMLLEHEPISISLSAEVMT